MTPTASRRLLTGLQIAFVLVFCFLLYSNLALRRQLKALESPRSNPSRPFTVSEMIPAIRVQDRDGRALVLDGKRASNRLLVLVHPRCKYCDAVLSDIAAHPRSDVDVLSLVPQAAAPQLRSRVPAAATLYFVDRVETSPLRFRAIVPQLLRIDGTGRVAQVCSSYRQCAEASSRSAPCSNCDASAITAPP